MKKTAFFLILFLLLFTVGIKKGIFLQNDSFKKDVDTIIGICEKAASRQRCYDREIPKLVNTYPMTKAFEAISSIQNRDNSYWFCHAGAHNISAREYKKNPSQWKEIMNQCPVGICSNGCLHGVLQEHFRAEYLTDEQLNEAINDMQGLCDSNEKKVRTPIEVASCYHELGHLSLYLANADVIKAGSACDRLATRNGNDHTQTCYEGIFMQIFEPREPDDFALIYKLIPLKNAIANCDQYTQGTDKGSCWEKGWENQQESFCGSFPLSLRYACYREAWVVENDSIESASGIISYCSYSTDVGEQKKCYNKLFYGLMALFEFDEEKLLTICADLPPDVKAQCFANTASRLIETDKRLVDRALAVCRKADMQTIRNMCYRELAHYANFALVDGSKEKEELCNNLPKDTKTQCEL